MHVYLYRSFFLFVWLLRRATVIPPVEKEVSEETICTTFWQRKCVWLLTPNVIQEEDRSAYETKCRRGSVREDSARSSHLTNFLRARLFPAIWLFPAISVISHGGMLLSIAIDNAYDAFLSVSWLGQWASLTESVSWSRIVRGWGYVGAQDEEPDLSVGVGVGDWLTGDGRRWNCGNLATRRSNLATQPGNLATGQPGNLWLVSLSCQSSGENQCDASKRVKGGIHHHFPKTLHYSFWRNCEYFMCFVNAEWQKHIGSLDQNPKIPNLEKSCDIRKGRTGRGQFTIWIFGHRNRKSDQESKFWTWRSLVIYLAAAAGGEGGNSASFVTPRSPAHVTVRFRQTTQTRIGKCTALLYYWKSLF